MIPMCGSIDVAFRLVYVCCEPLLLACSVNNSDSTPRYLYITITQISISNYEIDTNIVYHLFHIVNLLLSFLPFNRWVHLLPSLMVLTVMKRYVAMRGIDIPVCNIEISLKGWSSNRLGSGWKSCKSQQPHFLACNLCLQWYEWQKLGHIWCQRSPLWIWGKCKWAYYQNTTWSSPSGYGHNWSDTLWLPSVHSCLAHHPVNMM